MAKFIMPLCPKDQVIDQFRPDIPKLVNHPKNLNSPGFSRRRKSLLWQFFTI
ncbi:hypothetical protein ACU8KH_05896 [Lachancea thermotolerans]